MNQKQLEEIRNQITGASIMGGGSACMKCESCNIPVPVGQRFCYDCDVARSGQLDLGIKSGDSQVSAVPVSMIDGDQSELEGRE